MKIHDTIPKLLRKNKDLFGKRTAEREKDYGVWKAYTWEEVYDKVKYLSLGLFSLGLRKGDRVTIVGQSEPELYWSEFAVLCAGGVATAAYPDCTPQEIDYIFSDSQSTFAICEDQEQIDKFLELKSKLDSLRKVLFWDPKGMWLYDDPLLISFEEAINLGKELDASDPGLFDRLIEDTNSNDLCLIIYTSGTTGNPKGAMWTHNTLLDNAEKFSLTFPNLIRPGAEYLTFLSLAWSADQGIGVALGLLAPLVVNFPEEPDTVLENIREVAPEILFVGPMQWEGFQKIVESKMLDAIWIQKWTYRFFMNAGYEFARLKLQGKRPGTGLSIKRFLGEMFLYRFLRDRLGLTRLKLAFSAGTSVSPDLFYFFHAIGVKLRQGWGSTEIGWLTMHQDVIDPNTCGPLFNTNNAYGPPLELKTTEERELIARGGSFFQGYYNKHKESAEKVDAEGWYHMGDAGLIREDGHVIVIDRLEDMRILQSGERFSPQFIEVRLRFSHFVRGVLVLGDDTKPYVATVVDIEPETVGRWAEQRRISYTTFPELSQKEEIRELIRNEIIRVNQLLPSGARIAKFVNLHKPFDADEGELTRSRKLRRSVVEKRYADIIDSIYRGEKEFVAQAPVRYRDGRTGVISTKVKINDVS